MARQKSTIRFNPLAAAGPMDAATRDYVVPVQPTEAEAEAPPVETPVAEPPATDAPTVDTPLAEVQAADTPAAPPVDASVAEPPATLPPAAHTPLAEAQAVDAPAVSPGAPAPEAPPPVSKRRDGMRIVRRYMAFSAAAGILPLPAVDVAGAAAVQVKMLHAIARLYGIPFDAAIARQLVLAMLGGGGAIALALPAASAAKTVPVVGTVASIVLSPAFATLSCYGTGRAFVGHFEAGGTLQSFDPGKAATGEVAA